MERNQKKLAVSLVTYNAEKYLPFCLGAISRQTFNDFSLLIIDNGSTDRTAKFLKEEYPQLKIVEHDKNIGFAKAHNQAISWSDSEYVCLLNQDIILEPDYFERLIDFLDNEPSAGSISGKIYIWDFDNNQKTDFFDSLGLKILKNHRVLNIGQGEIDGGQYNETKEIFGVSGAAPVYRRQALEQVKQLGFLGHEEYFDELFFSYKEDVDLAWRLRLGGYKSFYLPTAIAYHDRSVKGRKNLSDKATIKSRKDKDKMVKLYSYKNHLQTLFKNEFLINYLKYFWPIAWYEFKKLIYIVFFEQTTLIGLKMYFEQRKKIKLKRKDIFKNIVKVKASDLARWYE